MNWNPGVMTGCVKGPMWARSWQNPHTKIQFPLADKRCVPIYQGVQNVLRKGDLAPNYDPNIDHVS